MAWYRRDRGSGIGDQRSRFEISDFRSHSSNSEAEKSDACAKWSFAVREANGAAILGRADGALRPGGRESRGTIGALITKRFARWGNTHPSALRVAESVNRKQSAISFQRSAKSESQTACAERHLCSFSHVFSKPSLALRARMARCSPRDRDGEAALDSAFELHDDRTHVGSMTRPTQIRCTRAAVSRGTLRIRSSRPSTPESWASLRSAQPTRSRRSATTRRLAGPVIGDPPVFTFVIPR